jgi:hypothetical protein
MLTLLICLLLALLVAQVAAYQPFARINIPSSIVKNPALSSTDKAINSNDNQETKESKEIVSSAKKINKMVAMLNTIKRK